MQTSKQLGFAANLKLAPTALVVIQLCKKLPPADGYIVYTDNFFTSTKLYKALKKIGIAAYGTAKSGSGFPTSLLALRGATTKKDHWGLKAYTVVDQDVLCMAWVDLNTAQLMTTAYGISDVKTSCFLSPKKRSGIPGNAVQVIPPSYLPSIASHSRIDPASFNMGLPVPYPIRQYNKYMGGSNGNAQQRATYTLNRRSSRCWWPLFTFLHDAACLNSYIIYKAPDLDSRPLTREAFIRSIALSLIGEPAGNSRKRKSASDDVMNILPMNSLPEHDWIRLSKKRRCDACKANKTRPFLREPLAERECNGRKSGKEDHKQCGGVGHVPARIMPLVKRSHVGIIYIRVVIKKMMRIWMWI